MVTRGAGAAGVISRLTRGQLVALGVAIVTIAGVVVLVAVFARGWWRDEGGGYGPKGIVASARVTPETSLFADVLSARADVLVDARRIDPRSVRLDPDFRPFKVLSESRSVENGVGRAALVRFRYAIECLTQPCLALAAHRTIDGVRTNTIHLKAAPLAARTRDGRKLSRLVSWAGFAVQSRLSADEAALSTPRIPPRFAPPRVSWAITPNLLGALSLAAAAVLVLGAGWLVASAALGDRRRFRVPRIPAHLTPVERALALAEHAAAHGESEEGRKALERLAIELRRAGDRDLAVRAGRLAWSEDDPSAHSVGELADAVRTNGRG